MVQEGASCCCLGHSGCTGSRPSLLKSAVDDSNTESPVFLEELHTGASHHSLSLDLKSSVGWSSGRCA